MRLKFALALLLVSTASCKSKAPDSPQASKKDPPVPPAMPTSDARQLASVEMDSGAAPTPSDLVDIRSRLPEVLLDIRYAGSNNFVGKAVYPKARCLVRRPVAVALQEVQSSLKAQGLQLLLWDCYRPFAVQEAFWKLVPDSRYVAQPIRQGAKLVKGSKHNRGAAVDLSLASLAGEALPMPTDHDDFSKRAHVGASGISDEARKNADLLRQQMQSAGFTGIATEWWHFDHQSWRDYDLSDHPL